jgi:rhamnose transport system permease protein
MSWLRRHIQPEQVRELILLLLIIVAVLLFGSLIENYYTSRTFSCIAEGVTVIIIVAVGQTLVVLTRNIDLSVGSIVGCTAFFAGTLIAHKDLNPILTVFAAIAMGAVNGVLVAWARIPSIIVTLGTIAIYRGLLVDLSGAE